MNENKHTPEPWCISDHNKSIIKCYQGEQTPHGTTPYFAGGGALESERTANARRVVACVNALEGLNDYALSGGWSFRGIEAYAKGLEKQRDELLEQVECSNITEKNMEGRLNKLIVQNAATKDQLDKHRDGRLSALEKLAVAEKQRDELLAALEHFATWARGQHRAQSKGCHATFDMMMLRDEIDFAEAAIASVKETK